ncbi:MAG TPA: D-2-hydroxyacid dehydrogenase family protein [Alphaproteobacteria bacterium]|nr:D-2-hydroxyacid dehydrogenase family protein [Alphaproteobacteria bacterium]
MTRVAILDDYQKASLGLADWARLGAEVKVEAFDRPFADGDEAATRLAAFEVIVAMRERTPFPRALIERLPRLRLLVTTGMRNAAIDMAAASSRGVLVCGTEMLPYPTAELTWGLILSLSRNIPVEDRAMRAGGWQTTLGVDLRGKTLGVIGLGRLGAEVARIGRAFGMEVVAWSRNLTDERATSAGAARVEKAALLARADVVTIHLVLSERTRGLIGAAELAAMKRTAFLVNTSRGPIVDTAALIEALRTRRIAGAALDVYDAEPLPADHPLRRLDNVVLTPHLGYVTAENYRQAYGQAVEDIAAFLAGKPVRVLNG